VPIIILFEARRFDQKYFVCLFSTHTLHSIFVIFDFLKEHSTPYTIHPLFLFIAFEGFFPQGRGLAFKTIRKLACEEF
jgi:hypothetical protein